MPRRLAACLLLLLACGGDDDDHRPAADGGGPAADGAPGSPDAAPALFPGSWQLALLARCNFSDNEGGAYRMPANHFLDGPAVQIGGDGRVAVTVPIAPDGLRHLWLGDADGGGLVYDSPADAFMSGVSIDSAGRAVFDLTMIESEGLYLYDPASRPTSDLVTTEPFGAFGRGDPQLNEAGQIGFRASFGDARAHYLLEAGSASPAVRVAETALDPDSPYSYLFSPAFNGAGDLASLARRGPGTDDDRPDEIVVWKASGEAVVIARDVDGDPRSPYTRFDASHVAMNDRGQVAFVAELVDGGARAVVVGDGASDDLVIAREGVGEVGDIEFFSPDINAHGWVVFRAFDSEGRRAIWVGDGSALERVASERDEVPTDLGTGIIAQESADNPVFDGGPSINDRGDVAFACGLAPADDDQVEWGTGIYLAAARP
jgi:hypothetical protein